LVHSITNSPCIKTLTILQESWPLSVT
jgi:hypothetical protein